MQLLPFRYPIIFPQTETKINRDLAWRIVGMGAAVAVSAGGWIALVLSVEHLLR